MALVPYPPRRGSDGTHDSPLLVFISPARSTRLSSFALLRTTDATLRDSSGLPEPDDGSELGVNCKRGAGVQLSLLRGCSRVTKRQGWSSSNEAPTTRVRMYAHALRLVLALRMAVQQASFALFVQGVLKALGELRMYSCLVAVATSCPCDDDDDELFNARLTAHAKGTGHTASQGASGVPAQPVVGCQTSPTAFYRGNYVHVAPSGARGGHRPPFSILFTCPPVNRGTEVYV